MSQLPFPKRFGWNELTWSALALLLASNIPIFLCQHLTNDAVMFDLQARCAFDGGVLYRDILEPNLPGAVWIHMLVRSVAGWSTYAIRAFDLLVLTGIVSLLWRASTDTKTKRSDALVPLALAIFWFYFSLSEWSHVQRDLWALLPCLLAMRLRVRTLDNTGPLRKRLLRSTIEGLLWGAAFWIKPHIALPALTVFAVGFALAEDKRRSFVDMAFVTCGGLIAGAIGSAWLISTGAWEHFWTMLLEWNPEYIERGRERFTTDILIARWHGMAPWSWAHVAAVVTAVRCLLHIRNPESDKKHVLLAAMYLGWMAQVLLLQFPFAYVHVPGVVLAIGLIATWRIPIESQTVPRFAFAAMCVFAALVSPATNPQRLGNWRACVAQGSSPQVRSAIQLEQTFRWDEMQPVIDYLRDQNVDDGDVTAYSGALCHIYPRLGIRPSTRFVFLDVIARVFRSRTDEIQEVVENCGHRYVVSSLFEAGMPREAIDGEWDADTRLPVSFPEAERNKFPYTQPVVFRSGQYLVHRVTKPIGPLCTTYLPLATR